MMMRMREMLKLQRQILIALVELALLSLVRNEDLANCPNLCSCSTIDPSTEGFCRGCPTGSTPSVVVKVKCEAVGLSTVPPDVPPGTSWLDLSKNNLTSLGPESMPQLSALIHVKLSQNNIQRIQDGAFQSMNTIQVLDLDLNNLTTLGKATFAGAETLIHLDLSGNRLENVDNVFSGLTELSRLDLRNNRLSKLTPNTFRGLVNLRYLLLTSNRIYYIERRAFRALEKLVYIVLKGNPIGTQTVRFHFHSDFLTYVDVSECGFNQVPKGLPGSARYLQLRRNNLTSLTRQSFLECPYVTILVLDENHIEAVEDRTFEHMKQLQQLWLNNNRLTKVPAPIPASVERLLMDLNRVGEITSGCFPPSSQIHTLSLMGNNITRVAPGAFDTLERLKTMDLSNNKLRRLHGNAFARLGQLKVLQLSSNTLQHLEAQCFLGLKSLATLSLAYVPTDTPSVSDGVFEDLAQLSRLDLDSSPGLIHSAVGSNRLLQSLGRVQELSMRSSDLSQLRTDFFQFLPNLTTFRLSSTRWRCGRSLVWLRDWMRVTSVRLDDSDENRCATPRTLHGRSLLSLDDEEFSEEPAEPHPSAPATTPAENEESTPPKHKGTFHPEERPLSSSSRQTQEPSKRPTSARPSVAPRKTTTTDRDYIFGIIDGTPDFLPPVPPRGVTKHGEIEWSYDSENDTELYTEEFGDDGIDSSETGLPVPRTLETKTTTQIGSDRNRPTVSYSRSTLAIVIATVAATLVIAIVIVGVIIHLTGERRSRRTRGAASTSDGNQSNHIPYKHKNGILYYTPSSGKADSDPPDLIRKTASGEVMTLIPGRDFNHEGPMRVYKWEDF